jgi:hypothetical protein
LDIGRASLPGGLSKTLSRQLSITFIQALGCEVAELMGNTSQQRLEIREHTGGEVNAPGLQAGKGKFGFVRMKTLAHFQEFLVFENDNGQPVMGVGGATQIVV